ncbi:hypothetical protein [Streptomyces carpinensis]|nr:hypothetical protein [Streptomyces carpinensis]
MPVLLPVSVFLLPATALDVVDLAGVEHVDSQNQRAMAPTGWKIAVPRPYGRAPQTTPP